jgi:hypothetical protein
MRSIDRAQGNSEPGAVVPGPMSLRRVLSIVVGPIAFVLITMVAACSPGATPGPTILPGPSGGGTLSTAELRLHLIDQFGPRWYCDPDFYPIAVQDEMTRMRDRWAEILADGEGLAAIMQHEGLASVAVANLTDDQRLAVYRVWKVLNSIQLDPAGQGRYRFDYLAQPVGGASEGTRTAGIISDRGDITVEQRAAAGEPPCPICLSVGTQIDTPYGPIAVEKLRLGDPVWTLDADGRRVAGTVIALGSTQAPKDHHVLRLRLADGRSVTASPGHPLLDGRPLGDLRVGDVVDGSPIVSIDSLPYPNGETFDLVASGPTGAYFAGGIPLGTTLR